MTSVSLPVSVARYWRGRKREILAYNERFLRLAMRGRVPHPDFGEVGVAVVTPKPGATPDADAIIAALKSKLANFKIPKRCFVVAELPRNRTSRSSPRRCRR